MPVNIQLSKNKKASSYQLSAISFQLNPLLLKADSSMLTAFLVGLGRVELPTSPLSGVRSSHLSYRPI
jgi:hypothetical protein